MADGQVTVVAMLKARPGQEEALERELRAMLEPTRAEPGCLRYDLHQGSQIKAEFMFYETWADRAAFEGHVKSAHFTAFVEKKGELLAEPVNITFWDAL